MTDGGVVSRYRGQTNLELTSITSTELDNKGIPYF